MITQTVTVQENERKNIIIGRRGTYNTEEIVFDLAYLIETYGAGQAVLMVKRPTDATAYPAVTTQTDGQLLWVVSDVDTSFKGHGECELYWYVGQALAKSVIFGVAILRDIGDSSEIPPDPYKPWVDVLVELGAETERNAEAAAASASDAADSADAAGDAKTAAETAQEAAEDAQEAAEAAVEHYPKIVDDYWYVWANGDWVNTGTKAAGTDGKGISSIVSAKTSTSGNVDTYTMTVTYTDGTTEILTFTVTNGVSPAVTITPIAHGHQVTITDETHPTGQTFDVLDGEVTEAELDGVKATITQLADTKAPVIVDTASGSIASFPDGADGMPVKDLTVGVEPVQDLHGYDNPWPSGGGKNLFNISFTSGERAGITYTNNGDGTILANGTASDLSTLMVSDPKTFPAGTYILNGSTEHATTQVRVGSASGETLTTSINNLDATFTLEEETSLVCMARVTRGSVVNNETMKPMLRRSTETDPTWQPYSNLCPISGRTGCEVTRTGRNLFDKSTGIQLETNNIRIARNQGYGVPFKLRGGVTYTFSCNSDTPAYVYITVPFSTTNIASSNVKVTSFTYTPTEDIEVGLNFWWDTGRPSDATDFMIEVGSVAHDYEHYTATTIPISWQTQAGTVYGCNIDPITGVLTVDREFVSSTWGDGLYATDLGNNIRKLFLSTGTHSDKDSQGNNKSNIAKYSYSYNNDSPHWYSERTTRNIYLFLPENTPNDTVVQFVCELAQPQTFQLDPVTVQTLLGQNNIFADAGPVSVDYCADTKRYIDKRLAALVAALS